jgi:chemotaxis-related protein WspD
VSASSPAGEACWSRIGAHGDGSCPELPALVHCRNCARFAEGGRTLFEREPPPGYFTEWTALLAREKPEEPSGEIAAVLFRVGEEWLALEVAHVTQVAERRAVRRIPHRSDDLLLGLVNVDGELLLCASLAALLGSPAPGPSGGGERLLAVSLPGERWAFPVDAVDGVGRIEPPGPLPASTREPLQRLARGLSRAGERTVTLLDPSLLQAALKRGGGG